MQKLKTQAWIASLLCALCAPVAMQAMHNTNRWLPLLEHTEPATLPGIGRLHVEAIFTEAATTFEHGVPGNGGIPELWGMYDLDQVICSAQKASLVSDCPYPNPFCCVRPDFAGRRLIYDVSGKVKSKGIALHYTQNLQKYGLAAGFYLPYLEVRSSTRFRLNAPASDPVFRGLTPSQIEQLDAIRRGVQESIGLVAGDYREWSVGDLDLYVRQYNKRDYILAMRSVSLNFQLGATLPTGKERVLNNAASIPFGNNGSAAIYGDVRLEFEPKLDWHLGFVAALNGQTSHTHDERMPVCCTDVVIDADKDVIQHLSEPLPYSSVVGKLTRKPGLTHKLQAYFGMDHLTDGLNFLVRLTRVTHSRDDLQDKRPAAQQELVPSKLSEQQKLSRWHATFLTLQGTYDTKDTGQNWPGDPRFYVVWDIPLENFGGARAVKTSQLILGVAFNF